MTKVTVPLAKNASAIDGAVKKDAWVRSRRGRKRSDCSYSE